MIIYSLKVMEGVGAIQLKMPILSALFPRAQSEHLFCIAPETSLFVFLLLPG